MINYLEQTQNEIIKQVFDNDLTLKFGFNSGGYECFQYFITTDGGVLSLDAVRDELKQDPTLFDTDWDQQWYIVASEINYENNDLYCDHTNKLIESAYED
jgi:hypothetical protein